MYKYFLQINNEKTTQLENVQETWLDISQKTISKCQKKKKNYVKVVYAIINQGNAIKITTYHHISREWLKLKILAVACTGKVKSIGNAQT